MQIFTASRGNVTRLVDLVDSDFDWFLERSVPPRGGLKLPPDAVDSRPMLDIVRRITQRLKESGCNGAWMIVADNELVGLCGYKTPPYQGQVEIGYGVTACRRNRGHATAAVSAVADVARQNPELLMLTAETVRSNPSSERVLEKNGFIRVGQREDADDGTMTVWRLELQTR